MAPTWVRVVTGVGVAALGWLVVWGQSLDPIFGFPVDDPASLVFLVLFGLAGVGVAVSPYGWRRVRSAPLPEDWADKSNTTLTPRKATGSGITEARLGVEEGRERPHA
jgi:hypothetical protein